MRARQGNTFQTFQTAADTCTRYLHDIFPQAPDWTVPKNFAPRLQELRELIADMQQMFVTQKSAAADSRVAVARAEHAQQTLRTQLMVIRQAARALTWEIPDLAARCRVPSIRARREAWHETVRAVLTSAAPHFAALVDEGVPADTLQQIERADAALAAAVADGIAARHRRTAATRRLPKLVTRGHQLLATLGVTMRAYGASDPKRATNSEVWAHATHVRRDPRRAPRRLVPVLPEPGSGGDREEVEDPWHV
ncbi:MAG TPA: hypothetical protein VNU46_04435 [Gemmatimonadaceae bacterium]|jgi:hypothetical protein|nr:hypothetical protein [Gemmatimonadaceae bacterium]